MRMHAVNNACRDVESSKGKPFDTASGTEDEEPIGILEISCWSNAARGFLGGTAWSCVICISICGTCSSAAVLLRVSP